MGFDTYRSCAAPPMEAFAALISGIKSPPPHLSLDWNRDSIPIDGVSNSEQMGQVNSHGVTEHGAILINIIYA